MTLDYDMLHHSAILVLEARSGMFLIFRFNSRSLLGTVLPFLYRQIALSRADLLDFTDMILYIFFVVF